MSKVPLPGNNFKIKKSLIWQTTQNLLRIMAELKEGYLFDKGDMSVLINACIDLLNGTIKPTEKGEKKLAEQEQNNA